MKFIIGDVEYYMENGERHREDGPAIITKTSKEWYQHNLFYREDGPARMWIDTLTCEFWIDHKCHARAIVNEVFFMEYWNK